MEPWPGDTLREIHEDLDSTNAEALRRVAQGARGPLWLLAHNQTAARGRRGRAWTQPRGNFAASLLMTPEGPSAALAQRSFVAALGLFDALVAVTGRSELFSLKWPNDVLLSGRKLAGILLETGGAAGRPMALVIGIGVNLRHAPDPRDLEPGATPPVSLAQGANVVVTPEEFLDRLGPALRRWENRLAAEGFDPIRAAWLNRAARLGETMTARLPGRELVGRFETIDPTGALVLATAQGRVALPAGEVFFGSSVREAGLAPRD